MSPSKKKLNKRRRIRVYDLDPKTLNNNLNLSEEISCAINHMLHALKESRVPRAMAKLVKRAFEDNFDSIYFDEPTNNEITQKILQLIEKQDYEKIAHDICPNFRWTFYFIEECPDPRINDDDDDEDVHCHDNFYNKFVLIPDCPCNFCPMHYESNCSELTTPDWFKSLQHKLMFHFGLLDWNNSEENFKKLLDYINKKFWNEVKNAREKIIESEKKKFYNEWKELIKSIKEFIQTHKHLKNFSEQFKLCHHYQTIYMSIGMASNYLTIKELKRFARTVGKVDQLENIISLVFESMVKRLS